MPFATQLLTNHAQEIVKKKYQEPSCDWDVYCFECLPPDGSPTLMYKLKGVVAPLITKGKNKGHRNWGKMVKETHHTIYIPIDKHEKWCLEWEKETGQCGLCVGEKEILSGWSAKDGTRKKQCPKCNGTGFSTKNKGN
jgi:hypothetical protein